MEEENSLEYPANSQPSSEEEMVENLADRIAAVLNSQKEMLATLESLTKDSLVPTTQSSNNY